MMTKVNQNVEEKMNAQSHKLKLDITAHIMMSTKGLNELPTHLDNFKKQCKAQEESQVELKKYCEDFRKEIAREMDTSKQNLEAQIAKT